MTTCNAFAGNACKNKHHPWDESLATTAEFLNKMIVQSGDGKATPDCL